MDESSTTSNCNEPAIAAECGISYGPISSEIALWNLEEPRITQITR